MCDRSDSEHDWREKVGDSDRTIVTEHSALVPHPHRVVMVTMDHEYRNANIVVGVLVINSRETTAKQTHRQTDRQTFEICQSVVNNESTHIHTLKWSTSHFISITFCLRCF